MSRLKTRLEFALEILEQAEADILDAANDHIDYLALRSVDGTGRFEVQDMGDHSPKYADAEFRAVEIVAWGYEDDDEEGELVDFTVLIHAKDGREAYLNISFDSPALSDQC